VPCPVARPEYFTAGSCTPNPAPPPPHARGQGGTTRGSSASQPPVVFRPYPPWVVWAGSGRVPGPKFVAGTAAGAACGFLGHREGQKHSVFFLLLSVGWCPSKRVVVIHCARPYTAQKAPGWRVRKGDFWESESARMHSHSLRWHSNQRTTSR
jgi:hypothetical protein